MRLLDATIALLVTAAACAPGGSPASEAGDSSIPGEAKGFEGGLFEPPLTDALFEPDPIVFRFALTSIDDAAAPCAWRIPDAPPGETLDFRRFRLVVLHDGGTHYLLQVQSSSECDQLGAWYFDSLTNPTQMILCPVTCDAIEGQVALEIFPGPTPPTPFR